jgi:hypothetical protein
MWTRMLTTSIFKVKKRQRWEYEEESIVLVRVDVAERNDCLDCLTWPFFSYLSSCWTVKTSGVITWQHSTKRNVKEPISAICWVGVELITGDNTVFLRSPSTASRFPLHIISNPIDNLYNGWHGQWIYIFERKSSTKWIMQLQHIVLIEPPINPLMSLII